MQGRIESQRRAVHFDELSQVIPDVRRIMARHRTIADWNLAQICQHLADSFVGSMEGFDLSRHRLKRLLIRRKMLSVALTKGIPRNYTVDPKLTPPPNTDLDQAVAALAEAIERYQNHNGKLHAHPLFGLMPREQWDRVHCVHCAHHLSFALPE